MGTFRIARSSGRVTAVCVWCGGTSGSRHSDASADMWKRGHTCDTAPNVSSGRSNDRTAQKRPRT